MGLQFTPGSQLQPQAQPQAAQEVVLAKTPEDAALDVKIEEAKNYNIVVTSDTQEDVFRRYKAAIAAPAGSVPSDALTSEDIIVEDILYITQAGETVVYLKSDKGVFRTSFDEKLLFIEEGDRITVRYLVKEDVTILSGFEVSE